MGGGTSVRAARTTRGDVGVPEALALGRAAYARVRCEGEPAAWLVCAACVGDERVAGRWQRSSTALRRATGGPAWRLGDGTLYVALALRDASTIIETPPDKILNRNVRGILAGLRGHGAPVVYGGRELLSASGRVIGLVGWTRAPGRGAVLLEAAIALDRSVDGEPPDEARFARMPVATLEDVWGARPSAQALADRLARGHEALAREAFVSMDLEPDDDGGASTASEASEGMRWSSIARLPIGDLYVGARTRDHAIESIAVRGDLWQEEDADARLLDALRAAPDPRADLDGIVAHIYGRGGAIIEGVELSALARCVREAIS